MSFKYVQTPAVALYIGMGASDVTARITPYPVDLDGTKLTMTDFGSIGYFTVDPKISGYEEINSFTGMTDNGDNTCTLTGITRNLLGKSPYTASSSGGKLHGASAVVVFSDNPQIYTEFANKSNDETILGKWIFPDDPSRPGIASDTDTATNTAFVTFGQLSRQAIAGAANASTTVKGLVELATQAEIDAKTTTGGTGAKLAVTPDTLRSTLLSDYVADSGAANAYVITPSPAITAYATGQIFSFKATNANTAASTLNVNGLGAIAIKKYGSSALVANDIMASQLIIVQYDGTNFQMAVPVGNAPLTSVSFGDGSDSDVTIAAGTTTLTRDMFYNNLTIQTSGIINPNGFRIFVKGTLTFQGTGKIAANGGNGGNGGDGSVGSSVGSAGTAGAAAATAGSLPAVLPGVVGGAGASGASASAGTAGADGTAAAKSLGAAGAAGGAGATGGTSGSGTGPGAGGAAGAAGSQTGTVFNKLNSLHSAYYLIDNQPTIVTLTGSAGSGGGGGGGGGRSTNAADCGAGGGGGGSGAPGGFVWVSAYSVVTVNSNTYLQAKGGNAGNGGAGGNSGGNNGGGGSGGGSGASGSGGVIVFFYHTISGSGVTDVTAGSVGTAGAAGLKNGTGTNGSAGSVGAAGSSGVVYTQVI